MSKLIVTTSWDDGHIKDLEVARLLNKYNLKGTFYISPAARQIKKAEMLSGSQIALISQQFEIGGHSYSHPDLSKLSNDEVISEVTLGKDILEKNFEQRITSFSYPYGAYNEEVLSTLKDLGFTYARTVKQFRFEVKNPLSAHTTVLCYSNRHNLGFAELLRIAKYNPIRAKKWQRMEWSNLAIELFDFCRQNMGIFHLWGHSWEIDQQNDWKKLERVFSYIANHEDVEYVSNSFLGKSVARSV